MTESSLPIGNVPQFWQREGADESIADRTIV